ncbi:MAG: zinc/manganese transport system permease protein [Frankiales bacterium]|nr:zinc/manganese transport system permease protein [Frankiales bacterium]
MTAPWTGLAHMLSHPFMQHAFVAGTAIAAAAGLIGYVLVLRGQVFTADALSHVAFTGALAALAFGLDARLGLFVLTIGVGIGMGLIGQGGRPDDTVIGAVFAWILGLGVLFLSIYTSRRSGSNGNGAVAVLFGSVLGLSGPRAWLAAGIAVGVIVLLLALARPLLLATLDERVARAAGVPVRLLGLAFLALTGATAAEATQVVGALLILGLIAAPAAAASRLSSRPFRAMGLSAGLAVASVWIGLGASYALPSTPPSFAILAVATAIFAGAAVVRRTATATTGSPASRRC